MGHMARTPALEKLFVCRKFPRPGNRVQTQEQTEDEFYAGQGLCLMQTTLEVWGEARAGQFVGLGRRQLSQGRFRCGGPTSCPAYRLGPCFASLGEIPEFSFSLSGPGGSLFRPCGSHGARWRICASFTLRRNHRSVAPRHSNF